MFGFGNSDKIYALEQKVKGLEDFIVSRMTKYKYGDVILVYGMGKNQRPYRAIIKEAKIVAGYVHYDIYDENSIFEIRRISEGMIIERLVEYEKIGVLPECAEK